MTYGRAGAGANIGFFGINRSVARVKILLTFVQNQYLMRRFISIASLLVILTLVGLFWWKFYFPYGEKGVKAGELNSVVKKGMIFKTWEGRLIQAGYKSQVPGSVQSNEFNFSITNEAIAEQLRLASGKLVELSYTEYLGALPWRGNSKYIVDSIITITDPAAKSALHSPY
jgi:hypothetical protein